MTGAEGAKPPSESAIQTAQTNEARDRQDAGLLPILKSIPNLVLLLSLVGGGTILGVGGATTASELSKKLDAQAFDLSKKLDAQTKASGDTLEEIKKTVQSVESDLRLFKATDGERRAREADYEARLRVIEKTITEFGVQLRRSDK